MKDYKYLNTSDRHKKKGERQNAIRLPYSVVESEMLNSVF